MEHAGSPFPALLPFNLQRLSYTIWRYRSGQLGLMDSSVEENTDSSDDDDDDDNRFHERVDSDHVSQVPSRVAAYTTSLAASRMDLRPRP